MTPLLVLSAEDVVALLDVEGCIDAMEQALSSLARGEAVLPLRPIVKPPDHNTFLGLMPVFRGGQQPVYGLKTVAVAPENAARGLDPHQGTVTLFDGVTGQTLAVMNAAPVTAIRTAACSAVATKLLAREDAKVLTVVGAGHQAHAHLPALTAVRDFTEIRVASRSPESAARLADGFPGATAAASVEEAVRGADVVALVTSSHEPVVERAWVSPGTHINAVGACFPTIRELDTQTVVDSRFYVDRRESAENEAGDFLIPLHEGVIDHRHIVGEIGDVLIGALPGRGSAEEITVFESQGLAIEDLFAAEYIVRRGRESGRGVTVEF
jgi:ornithine cyclodeaminase